jgi:hypothetical protein
MLVFKLKTLPDPGMSQYVSRYGGNVNEAILSSQTVFLKMFSQIGKEYPLTACLRYMFFPKNKETEKIQAYLLLKLDQSDQKLNDDLNRLLNKSSLSTFYSFEKMNVSPQFESFKFVIEAIKKEARLPTKRKEYKEILNRFKQQEQIKIPSHYYLPFPFESDNNHDFIDTIRLIHTFTSPIILDLLIKPTQLKQKEQAKIEDIITRLREIGNINLREKDDIARQLGVSFEATTYSLKDGNAVYTSKIYEEYHKRYLTEDLFEFNIRVFSNQLFEARLALSSLLISATQNARFHLISIPQKSNQMLFQNAARSSERLKLTSDIYEPKYWDEKKKQAPHFRLHRLVDIEEIKSIFRLPIPSNDYIPGMLKESENTYPSQKNALVIGYEEKRQVNHVCFKPQDLCKHAFIAGVPGSGKTTAVFNILIQLWERFKIPFIVIEPSKTEYRSLVFIKKNKSYTGIAKDLRIFTLGNDLVSPFRFNPFAVLPGCTINEHISNLETCFKAAMPLSGPLPALLSEGLEKIYDDKGLAGEYMFSSEQEFEFPTLDDLYTAMNEIMASKGYEGEVKGNIKTALEVRIASLMRRNTGAMLNTSQNVPDFYDLMKQPVILEMDALNKEQTGLMTLFLLNCVRTYAKTNRVSGSSLAHIIAIEEAHNIIGHVPQRSNDEANPQAEAASYVSNMLAEMRALGEGIIIADQMPTAVADEVIKNTNIKITHRMVSEDDRHQMAMSMLLDGDDFVDMARLSPGQAYVFMEGWYCPTKVVEKNIKVDYAIEAPPTNTELIDRLTQNKWFRKNVENVCHLRLKKVAENIKDWRDVLIQLSKLKAAFDKCLDEMGASKKDIKTYENHFKSAEAIYSDYNVLINQHQSLFSDIQLNKQIAIINYWSQKNMIYFKDQQKLIQKLKGQYEQHVNHIQYMHYQCKRIKADIELMTVLNNKT